MSYKIRYYITYCDDFNTDRNVFIKERGWTGGATELLADYNPISITYDSNDDFKFSPIRPSTAEVFLIFNSESGIDIEDFWTADERKYKIEDIKDGTLEWVGYLAINGFSYDFKGGLYKASLIANDGLGGLDALLFEDDNNKPYGNQDLVYNNGFEFPPSLIITEILKKLNLNLDLWTCVDNYEATMLKIGDVREADPLSSCYFNVKTYIKLNEGRDIPYWFGSGDVWNCKEVLENLLYVFGAKLYQELGVWRVKTVNSDINYGTGATQRYWRKYNNVGTYLGNYEIVNDDRVIPCNDSNKYLLGNSHTMSMDDVYDAFRINYEYTLVRDGDSPINLIKNGTFAIFDGGSAISAPFYWSKIKRVEASYNIRCKQVVVTDSTDAGGNTFGLQIGENPTGVSTSGTSMFHSPNWALLYTFNTDVNRNVFSGDVINFEIWNKFKFRIIDTSGTIPCKYRSSACI